MKDRRLRDVNDQPIPFTCANHRFRTDTTKGECHGDGNSKGSVLRFAIIPGTDYSLWLEHVEDLDGGPPMYWLMWYKDGRPTIPMSGVFDKKGLELMVDNLSNVPMERV